MGFDVVSLFICGVQHRRGTPAVIVSLFVLRSSDVEIRVTRPGEALPSRRGNAVQPCERRVEREGGDVFLGLMYPSALLLPQTHLVWFRLHPEINVTHPDARESDKGGDNASPTVRCLGNSIGKQCSMVRRSG